MSAAALILPAWVLLAPSAAVAQVADLQASGARQCAVCHLSWSPGFTTGGGVLLVERPKPGAVSADETCLGCHDGSVGDSRQRVWLAHGHRVGVEPRPGMVIPERLPLTNGRLDCRTCHSAHAGTGPETIATAVFIRVPNDHGQLCRMCHAAQDPDLSPGHHFLGRMAAPPPAERRLPHAVHGPDGNEVTCQSCHTPHGGEAALLLLAGGGGPADLCLGCHAETVRAAHGHPLDVQLPGPQPVDEPASAAGWPPQGERPACSACHRMHGAPSGEKSLLVTARADDLCAACHAQIAARFAGAHDFRAHEDLHNAFGESAAQAGRCGFCHRAHDARGPALWAATTAAPGNADQLCTLCHSPEGLAPGHVPQALVHPRGPHTALARSWPAPDLPLFDDGGRRSSAGQMACATCHDPHGNSRLDRSLLRTLDPAAPQRLCTTCHPQAAPVDSSLHGREVLAAYFARTGLPCGQSTCGPCHVTHGQTAGGDTWAGPRQSGAWLPDAGRCLGCHGPDAVAPTPGLPSHPRIALGEINVPGSPSFMPLIGAQREPAVEGWISCSTCHLPHGRSDVGEMKPVAGLQPPGAALRALKPMLRSYVTPNLCSACHGAEGLNRFLHYHGYAASDELSDLTNRD